MKNIFCLLFLNSNHKLYLILTIIILIFYKYVYYFVVFNKKYLSFLYLIKKLALQEQLKSLNKKKLI